MKTYKSNNIECQAAEYGVDAEADQYVHLCYTSGDQIYKVPRDMLGRPKNAFNGVKTSSGWKQVEKGDFIVKQNDEISLISGSFFKNNFEEVKP